MVSRVFLIYVLVELAAVVALTSTIGLGRTVLVLLGTFVVGLAVAGSQISRQLTRLRGPLTDSALVAAGGLLVVVPGLVTTVAGLLLLLPPTRVVARPIVTSIFARKLQVPSARRSESDVIEGEVIDVTDVEPVAIPPTAE